MFKFLLIRRKHEGVSLDQFLTNPESHIASKVLMMALIKEHIHIRGRLQKYEPEHDLELGQYHGPGEMEGNHQQHLQDHNLMGDHNLVEGGIMDEDELKRAEMEGGMNVVGNPSLDGEQEEERSMQRSSGDIDAEEAVANVEDVNVDS